MIRNSFVFIVSTSVLTLLPLSCGESSKGSNPDTNKSYFIRESKCQHSNPATVETKVVDSSLWALDNHLLLEFTGDSLSEDIVVKFCKGNKTWQSKINKNLKQKNTETTLIAIPIELKHIDQLLLRWEKYENTLFKPPVGKKLHIKHPANNPAKNLNLKKPLKKALAYSQEVELEPIELLMFERLIAIYKLQNLKDVKSKYLQLIDNIKDEQQILQFTIPSKMMDKNVTVDKQALLKTPWPDIVIFSALHCSQHPLPENTAKVWQQELEKGGYPATHVLLAYKWAMDNRCTIKNLPDKFADFATDIVISTVDVSDGLDDLEIEAICWTLLLDFDKKIKTEWLQKIIAQQNSDGGWSAIPGQTKSNAHTSGLAAWILLDLMLYNQSFSSHIDT